MKVGIVIPVYNRPEYVRRCFDSLKKLTTQPDIIILVNDASKDAETISLLSDFNKKKNVLLLTNTTNKGVRGSLLLGIDKAFELGCNTVINLDSDAVVKPESIKTLVDLKVFFQYAIISGFNCTSARNPPIETHPNFCVKKFCNGINMCFNKKQYEKYIRPNLKINGNWDFNTSVSYCKDNSGFIVTSPSVVQHIGINSSMGHSHFAAAAADRADDFKFLSLPDVTLFGIDTHNPKRLIRACDISQRDIEFGAVKIITEKLFTGIENYSKFIIKKLSQHFNTSHVLVIQHDGYILNWEAWDNSWLGYDYIGATWWYKDNMNVGNGGFSLRSKKLCDILASQDIPETYLHPEDNCICRVYRKSLEKNFGIKFAPEEVANKFSVEAYATPDKRYNNAFGFHGYNVDFSETNIPIEIRAKK